MTLTEERKELEQQRRTLDREKKEFFRRVEIEDRRLEQQKSLFEMKFQILEEELIKLAAEREEIEKKKATTFIKPTNGRLTSGFGNRKHPLTKRTAFHAGIDLANSKGTRINASRNGQVIFAGNKGTYGKFIVIRHASGVETAYAHLSSINVRVGQNVSQGQHIGNMGSTGRSTGSHLHFEIRINGSAVNPLKYIK